MTDLDRVLAIGLLCLVVLYALKLRYFDSRLSRIPGPHGLPLIGCLMSMNWPQLHLQLTEWQQKYGPVLRLTIMGSDTVVLSSAEAAKEALVQRGVDFAGRPPWYRLQRVAYFKGLSSSTFSPATVEQRKVMHHQLRALGDEAGRIEKMIMEEMEEFLGRIESLRGAPFDSLSETQSFFCNIIATQLWGERYCYGDRIVHDIMQLNEAALDNASLASSGRELDAMPWLRFTGLFQESVARIKKLELLRDRLIMEKLRRERVQFDSANARGVADDLISFALNNRSESESQVLWDDETIVAYLLEFIVAGTSTSSRTMLVGYIMMLRNIHLQEKIQEEIDRVIGSSQPALKHRCMMPFTEAFILELLRYATIAPLLLPHSTIRDTSVSGYFIPANTRVLINSWGIHHNAEVYPEPFSFRPERFLNDEGKLHSYDHPTRSSFIVFGAGRRICPGEQFALARLFLVVASLLQRFTLLPDESRPLPDPDPRRFKLSTLLVPPDCFVRALPRK